MAVRVHVVAARDVDAATFQQALTELRPAEPGGPVCQPFRFGASGDWQWAWASVWHVGGDEIDRALAALPGPALRTTTSDGSLWMLALAGGGREPFRGVHFFTSVGDTGWDDVEEQEPAADDPDFPAEEVNEAAGIDRDDPELQFLWDAEAAAATQAQATADAAAEKPWQSYSDYGVALPEDVCRQMQSVPRLAAERIAFYAHAVQIADALAERGIAGDREALVRLLAVGPLSERERDSDLGNLPRFLAHLGIVGWCDEDASAEQGGDWSQHAQANHERHERHEGPAEPEVDWSQYAGRLHLAALEALTAGREPTPLTPQPLDLTFAEVAHLMLLADFCDADDGPVLVVLHFPTSDFVLDNTWADLGLLVEVECDGAQCAIAFSPLPMWLEIEDRAELLQLPLVRALGTLPQGLAVELTHSVAGTCDGCHRYRGAICSGGFRLEAAYPTVTAQALRQALDLLDLTLGMKAIPLDNEEEERLVREAYQRDLEERPRIRHGKIKPDYGERHVVVRSKFFAQFRDRGVWDVEGAQQRRAQVDAEISAILNGTGGGDSRAGPQITDPDEAKAAALKAALERMEQAKKAPRTDDLIFSGKVSRYFHAPILALPHVTAEEIAAVDQALAELGFAWVCDQATDRFGVGITRCYAGPDNAIAIYERRQAGNEYALAADGVVVDFSRGCTEFHTHFGDGSTLATVTTYGASSIPKQRIFVRTYEDLSLAELWKKHLDGIARLAQKRNTRPLDHTPFRNPAALTAAEDGLIARFLGEA